MTDHRRSANSKNPPAYTGGDQSYTMWKKELMFWCEFTELTPEERGFAVLFRIEDQKAKEAIMRLELEQLKCADGIKNILAITDELFEKDANISMYECYVSFEDYRRPTGTSISEFINEFERRLNKTKEYKIEMSENLLAFRLLKCCNLSQRNEQLARATIKEWDYTEMKKQLKQIYGDSSIDDQNEFNEINQLEYDPEAFQYEEQALYARSRPNRGNYRSRNSNNYRSGRYNNYPSNRGRDRGSNPPDRNGRTTTCGICGSRNHWAQQCPDKGSTQTFEINKLELFHSDYDQPERLKQLVSDTFDAAVLDTAATKTAAGSIWMNEYIRKLSEEERANIKQKPSSSSYRFGDGEKVTADYATTIPVQIGNKTISIDVDVLNKDIPCLLSRPSMEEINTQIDLKNQQVTMLDQKIPMFMSRSGHYCIPLTPEKKAICSQEPTHTTLIFSNKEHTKKQIAEKLHSNFSHPSANKLVALVKSSGHSNDKELVKEVRNVTSNCKICKEFRRPPRRPVVGLPMATNFNECLQLDLKFFNGKPMLHMIDHATRLSSCILLNSKKAEEVFRGICTNWLAIYGAPQ